MPPHEPIATHRAGARQLRSYRGDLISWLKGMLRGYLTGVVAASVGAVFVLTAAGFAVAAVFHGLAVHFGLWVAFASVGGFFILVGLILLAVGIAAFRRPVPPLPRPTRQLQELRRAAAFDLLLRSDQVQSLVRRQTRRFGMAGAGVLTLGALLYGLSRLRRADRYDQSVPGLDDEA